MCKDLTLAVASLARALCSNWLNAAKPHRDWGFAEEDGESPWQVLWFPCKSVILPGPSESIWSRAALSLLKEPRRGDGAPVVWKRVQLPKRKTDEVFP